MSYKHYYLPRQQLVDLLGKLNIIISGETSSDLLCLCPFHSNRDSPALNVSLRGPHLWKCWNGKCNSRGNIITLIMKKGYSFHEAEQMVYKGATEISDLEAVLKSILYPKKKENDTSWGNTSLDSFSNTDESNGYPAAQYLESRGIGKDAYDYFNMGYSSNKDMLVIPVVDRRDNLCGVIGREIKTKRYQYSTGLARSELVWNMNNAKLHDSIILTEGALDSVYVWQAGYENVGAVLGSSISGAQWAQIREYFTEVICMFDNDEAGKALTEDVINRVRDLEISFVEYPSREVDYVDDQGSEQSRPIKDAGELTVEEIKFMLENRKSSLELLLYGT